MKDAYRVFVAGLMRTCMIEMRLTGPLRIFMMRTAVIVKCIAKAVYAGLGLSYFSRVVDECKQYLLELRGRVVTLNFVKRSANAVAHFLARSTSSLADRSWNRENVDPDLLNVMLNDLKH